MHVRITGTDIYGRRLEDQEISARGVEVIDIDEGGKALRICHAGRLETHVSFDQLEKLVIT